MISNKIRCNLKLMNQSVLAISSKHGMGKIATTFGCQKYATCKTPNEPCKEPKQTAGQKVVQWPQDACPTVAWRCECPREPQPPNYDPYRIKVPDVVVPPLPPCNAKHLGAVLMSVEWRRGDEHQPYQHHHSQQSSEPVPEQQPSQQEEMAPTQTEEAKQGGLMGLLRSIFGNKKKGSTDQITSNPNIVYSLSDRTDLKASLKQKK